MRANDENAQEYIDALEIDNDHLRAEVEELNKQLALCKAELWRMVADREFTITL